MALFNNPLPPQSPVAQAPIPPAPVAAVPPAEQFVSVPSDGTMNEYLMAHQEFSPSSEIQGLAPYIRSVSRSQQAQGR
jgi:sigma-E factor negative regulatory protein RseA